MQVRKSWPLLLSSNVDNSTTRDPSLFEIEQAAKRAEARPAPNNNDATITAPPRASQQITEDFAQLTGFVDTTDEEPDLAYETNMTPEVVE